MSGIFSPICLTHAYVVQHWGHQVLSANTFRAIISKVLVGTSVLHQLKDTAVHRRQGPYSLLYIIVCMCVLHSVRGQPGLVEHRQRHQASQRRTAQLCIWNPLGLHNGRWPSSSKQKLKEPAPSRLPAPFSICLIPRAVCGRKGLNGTWMSKCKNPRDLHCPQTELYCNLGAKIFIAQDVQQ